MIKFPVPGCGEYELEHLVMDVNGTLAIDGQLMDGVAEKIASLRDKLIIHLLAADLIVPDILSALELFEKPLRIVASLRK